MAEGRDDRTLRGDGDMNLWRRNLEQQLRENLREWEEEQSQQETMMRDVELLWGSRVENSKRQSGQKRRRKDRGRQKGHEQLFKDYFSETPTYFDEDFRRRFRMTRRLFMKILEEIPAHDSYFEQSRDAAHQVGLSPLQKVTAAMRQLAYGIGADATDEYCRIGESTARESLYRFCKCIRELYGEEFLRKPTHSDLERNLKINADRGFPGMFASLDCMHYEWANCPVAWQGAYGNKDKKKTIVLEAVADGELRFWHAFFGLPGGNNDLNVLERSPLVNDIILGKYNHHSFQLGNRTFNGPYLLADGIYPKWTCFVKIISEPQTEKTKLFAKVQEGLRKDVERAFRVLQSRFGIITQAARPWHVFKIMDILLACVILHNMIIDDERGENHEDCWTPRDPAVTHALSRRHVPWQEYLEAVGHLESTPEHFRLQQSLIDHLWDRQGSR